MYVITYAQWRTRSASSQPMQPTTTLSADVWCPRSSCSTAQRSTCSACVGEACGACSTWGRARACSARACWSDIPMRSSYCSMAPQRCSAMRTSACPRAPSQRSLVTCAMSCPRGRSTRWSPHLRSTTSKHPDKRDLLARIHRALRPGGVFVNAEHVAGPTPWLDGVYRAMWREACRAVGAGDGELAGAEGRMEMDRSTTSPPSWSGWVASGSRTATASSSICISPCSRAGAPRHEVRCHGAPRLDSSICPRPLQRLQKKT